MTYKPIRYAGLGLMAAATATGCSTQTTNNEQRPNIIYLFADDIGAECFGCYGGASYSTPNIDHMAEQGILYNNMFSMPLSCPSRVQFMTGLYNDRNYVAFGYMNDDENTFAHLARTAGYSTCMVGKWQLGRSREMIDKLGFDEWFLNQVEMYKESRDATHTDRYANSYFDNNGHYEYCLYGPDAVEEYAFDYMERMKQSNRPFVLYWSNPLVHTPHVPTPDSESWDLDYAGRFTGDTKNFPDMVKYLDKQVGELIDYLKKNDMWDNTIVIFTADNGTSTRITSQMVDGTTVQGGKGMPTCYGTHVPLIVTWGDKIAPRKSDRLVDLTDFLPTFADAMGVEVPSEWNVDGISLYPELCGDKPLERELTLIHFNPLWPTVASPLASRYAQTAEWKYYWDGRFFNFRNDPLEQNPVDVAACSDEVKAVYDKLKARVDQMPDWYPEKAGAPRRGNYGTFYDFAPPQNPF